MHGNNLVNDIADFYALYYIVHVGKDCPYLYHDDFAECKHMLSDLIIKLKSDIIVFLKFAVSYQFRASFATNPYGEFNAEVFLKYNFDNGFISGACFFDDNFNIILDYFTNVYGYDNAWMVVINNILEYDSKKYISEQDLDILVYTMHQHGYLLECAAIIIVKNINLGCDNYFLVPYLSGLVRDRFLKVSSYLGRFFI